MPTHTTSRVHRACTRALAPARDARWQVLQQTAATENSPLRSAPHTIHRMIIQFSGGSIHVSRLFCSGPGTGCALAVMLLRDVMVMVASGGAAATRRPSRCALASSFCACARVRCTIARARARAACKIHVYLPPRILIARLQRELLLAVSLRCAFLSRRRCAKLSRPVLWRAWFFVLVHTFFSVRSARPQHGRTLSCVLVRTLSLWGVLRPRTQTDTVCTQHCNLQFRSI